MTHCPKYQTKEEAWSALQALVGIWNYQQEIINKLTKELDDLKQDVAELLKLLKEIEGYDG